MIDNGANARVAETNGVNGHSQTNGTNGHVVPVAQKVNGEVKADGTAMDGEVLAQQHLEPLWLKMDAMVPPTPNPVAAPHIWKYQETLPYLLEAGRVVPAEAAERRVLMLVNPKMGKYPKSPYTTDSIYGGLQLVNPGETAPAHRHIAFAIRFIIDGEGFTAVEGKKIPLKRGDVIVTPTWHWHDHGNESDKPVIWLDALNLPLFRFARVHIAEGYEESRYPSTLSTPCEWSHPWEHVEASLLAQEGPHTIHHYTTKGDQPLSTTLGVQAERIEAGHITQESRDVASFLVHCYTGDGLTIVEPPNGPKKVIEWTTRDTFVIPAYSKVTHVNKGTEPAYLVLVHDKPLLKNLGLNKPDFV
ncbi:unnamed protein product [Parascedosporium putredinis]|uniref:Cupin type-2 domain-containing protein n=1 Tax=Parascedosporium putredinis TaxID=1442378 RepID=A0A9P1H1Z9_9PEZI|nr:unnamed protein product [Parascedosporium putredinis]CAI7993533.1 unnamed protein product [Parascedosporium putredinis]